MENNPVTRMLRLLGDSPCNFFAVDNIARALDEAGFTRLDASKAWNLETGGRYYLTKNDTAIFAFRIGTDPAADGFRIIASHSDSPGFKLKPNAEIYGENGVVSLNVEKYGGPIMYTWFDRPLSMAGRVMLRSENPLRPQAEIIDFAEPICTVPHLAIHFNRAVNEGNPLSVQKDMKPVLGRFTDEEIETFKANGGIIRSMLATALKVEPDEILDWELALYPVEKPVVTGLNREYFQSGRIDDLSMAFASLEAMLQATAENAETYSVFSDDTPRIPTLIMAVFDNEETGSGTKQGAASPVLLQIMERILAATAPEGSSPAENSARAIENSFMISADNAHAFHPNYADKYDPTNHPVIGNGPVIKINANCKYMTDSQGAAVFRAICESAGVECQYFVNHADVAGGSTLGNILTSQIPLRGVDMGCGIWAMHSACETAGVKDYEDTVRAFTTFYTLPC